MCLHVVIYLHVSMLVCPMNVINCCVMGYMGYMVVCHTRMFCVVLPNAQCYCWQVFGPAFKRNSRWSLAQPVPDVGDEETPYAAVDKFYDFWFAFKSWREFPHADEEDVEQAESREEKR